MFDIEYLEEKLKNMSVHDSQYNFVNDCLKRAMKQKDLNDESERSKLEDEQRLKEHIEKEVEESIYARIRGKE